LTPLHPQVSPRGTRSSPMRLPVPPPGLGHDARGQDMGVPGALQTPGRRLGPTQTRGTCTGAAAQERHRQKMMEAEVGIEPAYTALQAHRPSLKTNGYGRRHPRRPSGLHPYLPEFRLFSGILSCRIPSASLPTSVAARSARTPTR
jgi:hypothetical protein